MTVAAEHAPEWAELDALTNEYRGEWTFTWTKYPAGRMFVAKQWPPRWDGTWIIRSTAAEVRVEIERRRAAAAPPA